MIRSAGKKKLPLFLFLTPTRGLDGQGVVFGPWVSPMVIERFDPLRGQFDEEICSLVWHGSEAVELYYNFRSPEVKLSNSTITSGPRQ